MLYDEGFRLIDCRHEQAAVHMAEAWARITGRLGVVAVTTPGHANALPGLINAMSTESPILNIAGSSDLRNFHRGIMQEIDQIGIARTVTKGAWLAHDPRRIPDLMSTAIRAAFEGRRGPTHLTVPVDVQSATVEEEEVRYFRASRTGACGPSLRRKRRSRRRYGCCGGRSAPSSSRVRPRPTATGAPSTSGSSRQRRSRC